MKPGRIRRVVLVLLACVIAIVGAAAAWLVGTQAGTDLIVRRGVVPYVPGLSVGEVRGSLLDDIELLSLEVRSDRTVVTVSSVVLEIDLLALLSARLEIPNLRVAAIEVRVGPSPEPEPPQDDAVARMIAAVEGLNLPVDVVLGSATIDRVSLSTDEQAAEVSRIALGAHLEGDVLHLSRFDVVWQGFNVSVQAEVRLIDGVALDATVSVAGPLNGEQLLASARFGGKLPDIQVDAEVLQPTALTATGRVGLAAGPAFDVALDWAPPATRLLDLSRFGGLAIGAGSARVVGNAADVDVSAESGMTIHGESIDVTADGRYTNDAILVRNVRVERAAASLEASGRVDPRARTFDLTLVGEALDPGAFFSGWGGFIDIGGSVEGSFGDDLVISVPDLTLDGELRGYPFTGALAGVVRGATDIDVDTAMLIVGDNEIDVAGHIGEALALDIDAALQDLSQLHAQLSGSIMAGYAVSGPLTNPSFEGTLEAAALGVMDSSVASLVIEGTAGITADAPVDLSVRATNASVAGIAIGHFDSAIVGTAQDHVIQLMAGAPDWETGAALHSGLDQQLGWDGVVERLELERAPFGVWRLRDPTHIALNGSHFSLESGCLARDEAEICGALDIGGEQPETLQLAAMRFDIGLLSPFMPPAVDPRGRFDLDVDLSAFLSRPAGHIRVAGADTIVGFSVGEEDAEVRLDRIDLDGEIDGQGYRAMLEIEGSGTDRVSARIEGVSLDAGATPISGSLQADWSNLAGLSLLSPNVGDVGGRITADVMLAGSRAEPEFDGRAALTTGHIELPEWGVVIGDVTASALSPDGRSIEFDASGAIDGQALRLAGNMLLDAAAGWPTQLRLTGDAVEVVQIADADIVVSPDLSVEVDLPNVVVRGAVDVPSALIAIEQLPEQAVRPSTDAVVRGNEPAERTAPILLDADIDLRLGEDVRYQGAGLSADLAGALRLRYSTVTSQATTGALSVTGIYEAFGQELTLERGELAFTGPLDDPALNIRAVRKIDLVTVGIDLTGTLKNPVTRIFSEPAMAEADAVSYLVFGRPLAVPDGNDPDMLRNAAVSLGLRQAVPVIQRIGDTVGLDEFSIESNDVDAGALMAGKYLSPRLYVRYSYGLFNRIGGLLVRYRLNERISIETRSGGEKSMDLLFDVERD